MQVVQNIKKAIGEKNSITHGACIWANGIMNAFTTNDVFLRDNINWAAKATNWGRFSATATLGVIHMGNKKEAMTVLNPYFTGAAGGGGNQQQSSPYSAAGAYYAYGLIHANQYNQENVNFFLNGFNNSGQNEAIKHGLCLGLGLVSTATKDQTVYDNLKNILYEDFAVAGEAAGLGMGLTMLGSADEKTIEEMLTYA